MTTEEKKAALIEAGVKVRSNASDETVAELYLENIVGMVPTVTGDVEPVEDVVSVEVAGFNITEVVEASPVFAEKIKGAQAAFKGGDIMAEFKQILETLGTKQLGARTPAVFEWADSNLPADEWNKIYAGKRYNGEILQPKA